MGLVTKATTTKTAWRAPVVVCRIDGVLRTDAVPLRITRAAGYEGGRADVHFPATIYPALPVPRGALCEIWIDPQIWPRPAFRGRALGRPRQTLSSREGVTQQFVDSAAALNDRDAPAGYNEPDDVTGEPIERMGARSIARELFDMAYAQAQTNGVEIPIVSLSDFPSHYAGKQDLSGVPIGTALEQLGRSMILGGRSRGFVRYGISWDTWETFLVGEGPVLWLTMATDTDATPANQPWGYPAIEEIDIVEPSQEPVNRTLMYGARRRVQATLTLERAWDDSIEDQVLRNWDRYTRQRLDSGAPNPDYIEGAEYVGRRWAIPPVEMTHPRTGEAMTRTPKIAGTLFDQFQDVGPNDDEAKQAPKMAHTTWTSDGTEKITHTGFNVQSNKWVTFQKPRVKRAWDEETNEPTYELPSLVRLTCVYEDYYRPSVDTGKLGDYWKERWRTMTNDSRRLDIYKDTYWLDASGAWTYRAGEYDAANDEDLLEEDASLETLEEAYVGVVERPRLPFLTLEPELGMRCGKNGQVIGESANIMRIELDLVKAETVLTVASGV